MKNIIQILLAFVLIHLQYLGNAQELDSKTRRAVNVEIFNVLDSYERHGRLTDNLKYIVPEFKEKFKALFADNAMVYCDIVLANKLDSLVSVNEYVRLTEMLYPRGVGISMMVDEISFPEHISESNYSSTLKATKIVSGISKFDIVLVDTFQLEVKVSYQIENKQVNNLMITNIDGPLSGKYIHISCKGAGNKNPIRNVIVDYSVKDKSGSLTTNEEGRATIEDLAYDDNVELSVNSRQFYPHKSTLAVKKFLSNRNFNENSDPNVYNILMKSKSWNAGLNVQLVNPSLEAGNNLYVDENIQFITNSANSGIGISGYLNYVIGAKNRIDWGIGIGFIFQVFTFDSNLDTLKFSYDATDIMGREYERKVSLSNIEESVELTGLEFPVSLFLRYGISEKISLTTNIGVSAGINLKSVSNSTAYGLYSGQYGPEFLNMEFSDDRIGDFGLYDVNNNKENELDFETGTSPFIDIGMEYAITGTTNLKFGTVLLPGILKLNASEPDGEFSIDSSNLNSTVAGYEMLEVSKLNFYIGVSKDF